MNYKISMTQPLPDSIIKIGSEHELVREKFQDLCEEVFNSKLFETDSLHDIMQMVAKRVVPLLTMDYPSLNEPLDLYVALRDDITRKYRELNPAVEIVETKPT